MVVCAYVQLCRATNRKTVHKLSKTLLANLAGVRRCSDADKHRKNETRGFVQRVATRRMDDRSRIDR